jgi:hypothetical protein
MYIVAADEFYYQLKLMYLFLRDLYSIMTVFIFFYLGIHRRNRGNYIGIQSTSINRRKTNLSGKKTNVGGRPRKCTNKEYIKPSNGHNLSKRILSNRSI